MSDLSSIFGSKVFNDALQRERLPKATYKSMRQTIETNSPLDPDVAEVVASVMKDWALEIGATHFSHWFQPMTGLTAEKHDSFISPTPDGRVILEFSGNELIQGEPDASSFPSGGLRATFEARGYTAWDCTSPAFVKDETLYIPTAFFAYTGEALDKKTPLLRSMEALNREGMRVLRATGNTHSKRIIASVGPEQEYFLIDRAMYAKRKDLIYTGRTLFGAKPPKGQEMEDQYFGAIKPHVIEFMQELDMELWKLGIPAKTRHNEVAPGQHELAPIFGTANVATDQNQLIMETMRNLAAKHNFACLLHEKPFAGVNGSGKHNNWSVCTDDGINLMKPNHAPQDDLLFQLILAAVIRMVDEYNGLIRSSAATPGNDHRLGANEAPPAIISVYLGEQLMDLVEQILASGEATTSLSAKNVELGASHLPKFRKDISDRNRTSPFAFTGNKFEFRMVGSSASISTANFVLNTAFADILCDIADRLEKAVNVQGEMQLITAEYIRKHQRIIFNGDNYAEEWVQEAERRGLPNTRNMVDAMESVISEKSIRLFEKHGVFTERELHSRYEIMMELYIKTINIEAYTALDMVRRDIIPAVIGVVEKIARSINEVRKSGISVPMDTQETLLREISALLSSTRSKKVKLETRLEDASGIADLHDKACAYRDMVVPAMNDLREDVDMLEQMIDAKDWPFPTYAEMLFMVR